MTTQPSSIPHDVDNFLKGIELFSTLTDEERHLVSGGIEIKKFPSGAVLFEENAPRTDLYIIEHGEVELFKKSAFGEEIRLAFFGTHDFLGEGIFIGDDPHSANARTLAETTVFTVSRKMFISMTATQPLLAVKILFRVAAVIARRMHQSNMRFVNEGGQYVSGRTRAEHDLLGTRDVPHEFYYGIQTLRAMENFNISGVPISTTPLLINALAMVKMAAARANVELELLHPSIADAIIQACSEIMNGKWHSQFVVDMIQGGAGTSTNMNANEVIANRALEILGYQRGEYQHCHPNMHVNCSQSTNDAYPTALKVAIINSNKKLTAVLQQLIGSFHAKGKEFSHVIKMGRTQLQDAVPMTLGQTFEAYAATLMEEVDRLDQNARLFLEVNLGGTAIGTGINAAPEYGAKVIKHLKEITGLPVVLAPDLIEATQDTGAFVMYSSAMKRLAVKLSKICNDLRLLSSGPRAGLHEINLPPMQPGSSIMPGKVNPVIPEVMNQIAFKVIGNDLTVTLAAEAGQLELNVMEPIIAQSIFGSIEILKNGMATLKNLCIDGITANEEHCRRLVERSIGVVTALNPLLGYEVCTQLAKEALESGRGVYEIALEKKLLTKEELDRALAPENMLQPQRK